MNENDTPYSQLRATAHRRELARVAEFLKNIENDVANYYILNFFAPDSFGKTPVLQRIWDEYERMLPASFVQTKSFFGENEAFALSNLLVHIIKDFSVRLPERIVDLPSGFEDSTDKTWLADLIIRLATSAKESERITLLLLDDYDAMPAESRQWFETKILSQLIKTKKTAMILTSELELRFRERIDLRMRLQSFELLSLSAEAISLSFPEYEGFAPDIHRLTGGLPTLTGELIQQLETYQVTSAADFYPRERELLRKFYRSHVNETVLQDLPQDLQETLLVLSLLRQFDITVLKGILPKVLNNHYQGYGTADYLDLIERLGSRVHWRLQGGYALNEALRLVLQGYVLTENRKLYEKVNRAAVVFFDDMLKKEDYREYYLVELLYHQLTLLKLEKKSDLLIHSEISDQLLQILLNEDIGAQIPEADLDALRNSLLQDSDLKSYISEDVFLTINKLINMRIEEKRVIPFRSKSA